MSATSKIKRSISETSFLLDDQQKIVTKKKKLTPPFNITNLTELIDFAWNYQGENIDWFQLWKLIPAMTELNNMIGLDQIKKDIVHLIMYYIQGLNYTTDKTGKKVLDEGELLHTVLTGAPGCGKSTLAHILAKIYSGLGFLTNDKVTVIKRTDLVGEYVGHSEHQTKRLLEKAVGGVVFLDEAYSMGNGGEKHCSFAKAAIDTINQFLTEHKHEIIFIIAGYKNSLEKSFFSINQGLERRFPWRFHIKKYSPLELSQIFLRMVHKIGWKIIDSKSCDERFFSNKMEYFENSGGDVETFLGKCKIVHTQRVFGMDVSHLKKLSSHDIQKGFDIFQSHSLKDKMPNDISQSMIYC